MPTHKVSNVPCAAVYKHARIHAAGDMVDAMAQGTAALRVAHRGLDSESVGQTMDELQEAMEANQEVSDAMSMPLPGQIDDVSTADATCCFEPNARARTHPTSPPPPAV